MCKKKAEYENPYFDILHFEAQDDVITWSWLEDTTITDPDGGGDEDKEDGLWP